MSPVALKSSKKSTGKISASAVTLSLALAFSSSTQAAVLFLETFDTPAADTAAFTTSYPAFSIGGSEPVSVSAGQAMITYDGGVIPTTTATVSGIGGDVIYSLNVGASNSNGSYNVGLRIGENNIVFHPGLNGGAFRIEGIGGSGNQDLGFTPANVTLHRLDVRQHATGLFEITLTDGDNPANVYNTSFTNAASVGADFGLFRNGTLSGAGIYDNLRVDTVPEPTVLPLLGLGLIGLLKRRR